MTNKQEIEQYFNEAPYGSIKRADVISLFPHINTGKIIRELVKDGLIYCWTPGRYPEYRVTKYRRITQTTYTAQVTAIGIRLGLIPSHCTRDELWEEHFSLYNPKNIYRPEVYNFHIFNHVLDTHIKEGKIKLRGNKLHFPKLNSHSSKYLDELKTLISGKMTFGVELEFVSKMDAATISHILNDNGIYSTNEDEEKIDGYTSWYCDQDSSIHSNKEYKFGVEVASRVLQGRRGVEELGKVLTILNTLKRKELVMVDPSAGLHVHHGTFPQNFNIKSLIKVITNTQPIMNTLFSENRWDETAYNKQATPSDYFVSAKTMNRLKSKIERATNFNILRFESLGTVEFRQCESTLSMGKILAWIIIGQRLINTSLDEYYLSDFNNLKSFFKYIKLNVKAQNVFKQKLNKTPIYI